MIDKIKLALSLLLIVAGIAGFYLLGDSPLVLRILVVIVGIVVAALLFKTIPLGQQAFGFLGDSIAEAKRVVWPTRKETIQTTIVVFVLVVVMAAFLWVVDIGFSQMIQWVLGRSA
jgi:preprotein translocase subunit SecE